MFHKYLIGLLKVLGLLSVAVGLYAGIGFLALPWMTQNYLLPKPSSQFAGSISVGEIRFNPFTLELALKQPSLKDAHGKEIFAASEVVLVVHGRKSLQRRGVLVQAEIVQPKILFTLDDKGKNNFASLVPPPPEPEKPSTVDVSFLIENLTIRDGNLSLQDRSSGRQIDAQWLPVDITLERIGTLQSEPGSYRLSLVSPQAGKLSTEGRLQLSPFSAEGGLQLTGFDLARFSTYLALPKPYELQRATGSLTGNYKTGTGSGKFELDLTGVKADIKQISLFKDAKPFLAIDDLSTRDLGFQLGPLRLTAGLVVLDGLTPTGPKDLEKESRPRLGSLRIDKIEAQIPAHRVQAASMELAGIHAKLERSAEGAVMVVGLPGASAAGESDGQAPAPKQPAGASPWTVNLGEVTVKDSEARFEDPTVSPEVNVALKLKELVAHELSTDLTKPIKARLDGLIGDNGQIRVSGQVTPQPLSALLEAELSQIDMTVLQPYLQQATGIVLMRGGANLRGDLHVDRTDGESLRFTGSASVDDLITEDRKEHREFLSWKKLELNEIVYENRPGRLSIREVIAREPYARVQIEPDRRLNIIENLAPPSMKKTKVAAKPDKTSSKSKSSTASAAKTDPLTVVVGNFKIDKGRADFTDKTLKPVNFHTDIEDLNGTIRGLSSKQNAKADIKLDGDIDRDSPVHISGQINPFQPTAYSNVTMSFRDINLTTLSPYSGKFAGYRINKGKLDMDLRYRLENDRMVGDNKFVLDHLELGERVESPDATSLPVRMAIALLKDSDGRIDLQIPVSGDLSSPNVSIDGLLVAAFKQLITKLVSSPVAILGALVPDGTEDLDTVKFASGSSQLLEAEKTKLGKIGKALKARSSLSLEIGGEADRKADRVGVADQELSQRLLEVKQAEQPGQPPPKVLSDEDYRRLLTRLYRERWPNAPEVQGFFGGPSVLEGAAFELAKKRYLDDLAADDEALRRLAKARAVNVRQYLIDECGLTSQQIYLLDGKVVDADGKPVGARLTVGG